MKNKIGATIVAKLKSIGNAEFLDDRSQNPISIPFWELCFMPIGILLYRFKQFLQVSALYALLISILAFATGMSYVCGVAEWDENSFVSCSTSMGVYITFFFLRLLIIAVFLRAWYKVAVCGEKTELRDMLTITVADWKLFAGMLIAVGCFLLPVISVYVLSERVPNPDWRMESLFFAVASSGFWLPFVALRFFSAYAFSVAGIKQPPLKLFWQRTTGNMLKIIVSLTLIMMLNAILFLNYNLLAVWLVEHAFVFGALIGDFVYNILFLLMVASFACVSIIQREALFFWPTPENETQDENRAANDQ